MNLERDLGTSYRLPAARVQVIDKNGDQDEMEGK